MIRRVQVLLAFIKDSLSKITITFRKVIKDFGIIGNTWNFNFNARNVSCTTAIFFSVVFFFLLSFPTSLCLSGQDISYQRRTKRSS